MRMRRSRRGLEITTDSKPHPANAYVLDGLFAVDANSGTTTSTLYTDTGKDKHEFFTYNVTLPTGATIRGIEVQLNAKADSALNAPKIYVQLSWNGGTTWTTALGTATLTTTNAPYTLGGPATNWGRTWGTADVSNTNFRVRVINVASSTAQTFSRLTGSVFGLHIGDTVRAPHAAPPQIYGPRPSLTK